LRPRAFRPEGDRKLSVLQLLQEAVVALTSADLARVRLLGIAPPTAALSSEGCLAVARWLWQFDLLPTSL
jgi:hypothetical protein